MTPRPVHSQGTGALCVCRFRNGWGVGGCSGTDESTSATDRPTDHWPHPLCPPYNLLHCRDSCLHTDAIVAASLIFDPRAASTRLLLS